MRLVHVTTCSLLVLLLAACSNRAAYDNMMIIKKNKCLEDTPVRHQECVFKDQQSYEEYRREREAHLQQRSKEKDRPNKPF